jgi:hypothetical protein
MKIKNVAPLGDIIRYAWSLYENEKDTGSIMVSHLFLIIGLSYPVWLADDSMCNFQKKNMIDKKNYFRKMFSTIKWNYKCWNWRFSCIDCWIENWHSEVARIKANFRRIISWFNCSV